MKQKAALPVIVSVEASVFSHATEDEAKVERALLVLLPEESGKTGLTISRLSGHYGDPLVILTKTIRGRKEAEVVLRKLVDSLSPLDRQRLMDELEDRVDDAGNLYLRLDKQRAYTGKIAMHDVDPIRLKFKFRIPPQLASIYAVRAFIEAVMDEIDGGPEQPSQGGSQ